MAPLDSSRCPVHLGDWAGLNGAYLLVLLGVVAHWVPLIGRFNTFINDQDPAKKKPDKAAS